MNLQVLAYDEGRFVISEGITKESIADKSLSLGIAPVLKYREDSNVVGALLNIEYQLEGKTAMFLGIVVSVLVDGWAEYIAKNPEKDDLDSYLIPVWDVALGFARGVLAEKTKNTVMDGLFIPVVDLEKFSATTMLEKEA